MTELTERRKADRAAMAAEVVSQAERFGLGTEVTCPGVLGARSTDVRVSGPHEQEGESA